MSNWPTPSSSLAGSVWFVGARLPEPEAFAELEAHGFSVQRLPQLRASHFSLLLEHEAFGVATLTAPLQGPVIDDAAIEHDAWLTPDEKDAFREAHCCVTVTVTTASGDVLARRKRLLHWLHAASLGQAVMAVDHQSGRLWSPAMLSTEVAHDAPLDIDGLFNLHVIATPDGEHLQCLRSHGLAELGYVDFDILQPADALLSTGLDYVRAIAHAILEGRLTLDTPRFTLAEPEGDIRLLDASRFDREASTFEHVLRRADAHLDGEANPAYQIGRAVVCEPTQGLMHRRAKACEWLGALPIEGQVLCFSPEAEQRMATRAQQTYDTLCLLTGEFAEFDLPIAVKLGVEDEVGSGRSVCGRWFDVTELYDDELEARPAGSADRPMRYALRQLRDWMVMTPAGAITPRSLYLLSYIREHRRTWEQWQDAERVAGDSAPSDRQAGVTDQSAQVASISAPGLKENEASRNPEASEIGIGEIEFGEIVGATDSREVEASEKGVLWSEAPRGETSNDGASSVDGVGRDGGHSHLVSAQANRRRVRRLPPNRRVLKPGEDLRIPVDTTPEGSAGEASANTSPEPTVDAQSIAADGGNAGDAHDLARVGHAIGEGACRDAGPASAPGTKPPSTSDGGQGSPRPAAAAPPDVQPRFEGRIEPLD